MRLKKKLNQARLTPQVEQIAREMTSSSQIMIIVKRALKLGIVKLVRLALNNIKYLPQLAKKDFGTGVKLLCELQILANNDQAEWVLHSQMADMAVALKNKSLIRGFFDLSRIYCFTPGIATNNPRELITLLANMHNIPESLVIYTARTRVSEALDAYMRESGLKFVVRE